MTTNGKFERAVAAWLDQVMHDHTTAFVVAYAISLNFNRIEFEATGELVAWPAIETIAGKINAAERTVQRMIAALDTSGHLTIEAGRGRSKTNRFRAAQRVTDVSPFSEPATAEKGDSFGQERVTELSPNLLRDSLTELLRSKKARWGMLRTPRARSPTVMGWDQQPPMMISSSISATSPSNQPPLPRKRRA
jgi:hypothetical protein